MNTINRLRYRLSLSFLLLLGRLAWRAAALPFKVIARIFGFGFGLIGRLLAAGLGLTLVAMGIITSLTGVGLLVGLPLLLLGFVLVVRSLIKIS